MFNLTTSNSVGYNGVSQIPDARCTPPYDASDSPGDKLRAYLHSEVQSGVMLSGDRKITQSDAAKTHQLDDVYTFKDSDLQFSHNIHSNNSRLRSPLHRKSEVLDKNSPDRLLSSPRSAKQVNGYSPLRNNVVQNGVHDNDKIMDAKSSPSYANRLIASPFSKVVKLASQQQQHSGNDLFSNLAMGDQRKLTDSNFSNNVDDLNETKNSIIRFSLNNVPEGVGVGVYEKQKIKTEEVDIKTEPSMWSTEGRVTAPLFSSTYKVPPTVPPKKLPSGKPATSSPRSRRGRGPALHEALQRITTTHNTSPSGAVSSNTKPGLAVPTAWVSPSTLLFECSPLDAKQQDKTFNNYVQPWLEGVSGCEPGLGRAERLAARRATLRRRTTQLARYSQSLQASYALHNTVKSQLEKLSAVDSGEVQRLPPPTLERILAARGYTTLLTAADRKKIRISSKILGGGECIMPGCTGNAMACAAYCSRHISFCRDQRLFASCTAKFSDNTQCKMPVINITNHLPLCDEHAWKRDNYNKISQELKPKKAPRKRPKPSAMIRPQKRNRKRKKAAQPAATQNTTSKNTLSALPFTQGSTSSGCEESAEEAGMGLTEEFIEAANNHHIVDEEVVAQVLGCPSAVFNDFFSTEQNDEYVPTREETEELERALEAVNQDVKSLEKLTASQSTGGNLLLDTFLDERTLAETLASLPDVFSPSPNCTA